MPLVSAKCTNCGANLKVDSTKDAAICDYCGTPFIVEKAINNYNITNNITGSTVNIYGGATNDFDIRGGVLSKYNGISLEPVIPNTVVEITRGAFTNTRIKKVTISEGVKIISDDWKNSGAFANCYDLTEVILPQSLEIIGKYAFSNSHKLKTIFLPKGLKEIKDKAFYRCKELEILEIPNDIERVGNCVFEECPNLNIIFHSKNTYLRLRESCSSNPFKGCKNVIVEKTLVEGIGGCGYLRFIKLEEEKNKTKSKNCYITTAICEAENKPDDCAELTAFRVFRDEWLLQQEDGQELINEYYETAPKIVKAINHKGNAKEIYDSVKEEYLDRCFRSLQKNDPHACKKIYIDMVRKLEKEYLH